MINTLTDRVDSLEEFARIQLGVNETANKTMKDVATCLDLIAKMLKEIKETMKEPKQ